MATTRVFEGPFTVEDDVTIGSVGSQSSGGSAYTQDGPITFESLVDLSGVNKCRVLMVGQRSRRVCGNDMLACTRRNHPVIVRDATRRGEAGWYLACPSTSGAVDGDARGRVWTTE